MRDTKTVTTWRLEARPLTDDDLDSADYLGELSDGTFVDRAFASRHWDIAISDDGTAHITTGYRELISEISVPATRNDFGGRNGPFDIPMRSLSINFIRGDAQIDASGNLLFIDMNSTVTITNIFGDVQVVELAATARFSDHGTSNPASPIHGAEQVLTPENMLSRFGSERMQVYFSLNDDGSIDEGSITTMHPLESERVRLDARVMFNGQRIDGGVPGALDADD